MAGQQNIDFEHAGHLLRNGGLVAFPTETVYGLGANALDPVAVARIFEAKQRPSFDPLIVHLAFAEDLAAVVKSISPLAEKLVAEFWPGPLTLVLPKGDAIPSIVTSGLQTVAVRAPSHPIAHELIRVAGFPLAAPSANRFGHLSPTQAAHVRESLGDAVDFIIDGGHTDWGVESTVVDATGDHAVVLRHGATTVEQLEAVVGPVEAKVSSTSSPASPGQMDSHYSPGIPLFIADGSPIPEGAAYLAFKKAPNTRVFDVEVLSAAGDLKEAAANLFDALHRLDHTQASAIYAELVPNTGLGRAINDRLRRASVNGA